MVLVTVRLSRGATMESALRKLDLLEEDVDVGYGLVPLDPGSGLFALRVSEAGARKLGRATETDGVYSDPRIEPYGPPQQGN
ncbi:hypothetical protein J5X84_41080 [Streptosporangiaceae bacterium NEAU-GS5]|nr:hypothetical protein [Streptosporangiaceae bacterium NEAU-GS5]